jgi:hypothetical protein
MANLDFAYDLTLDEARRRSAVLEAILWRALEPSVGNGRFEGNCCNGAVGRADDLARRFSNVDLQIRGEARMPDLIRFGSVALDAMVTSSHEAPE